MSNLAFAENTDNENKIAEKNLSSSNDSSVKTNFDQASLVKFTDNAVNKVKELIEEEGNSDLSLRVFITGGGCSGFQYGFTFDEIINEDDLVVEKDGVKFLVDGMSYQYLVGAEIDYVDSFEGSQFTIKNPNATTTCGCGSSFSI